MKNLAGKKALITGASAGIGMATALQLAEHGVRLVLLARREDRLLALKDLILQRNSNVTVEIVPISVTSSQLKDVISKHQDIDILVNNAGLAKGADPVGAALAEDWFNMIQTNIAGAFEVVRLCLPQMLARQSGHIVNLGSIAGHHTYEGGSVYSATKHALRAFTQALRLETCAHNVKVTLVSPGMVETEFSQVRFSGDTARAKKIYEGMQPLTPEDIASQILWALKQPDHVNLDDIVIMPTCQGGVQKVHRQ
jgi:3-hydroxy acid dehydrogenase / malonic semialdehyde reductase